MQPQIVMSNDTRRNSRPNVIKLTTTNHAIKCLNKI